MVMGWSTTMSGSQWWHQYRLSPLVSVFKLSWNFFPSILLLSNHFKRNKLFMSSTLTWQIDVNWTLSINLASLHIIYAPTDPICRWETGKILKKQYLLMDCPKVSCLPLISINVWMLDQTNCDICVCSWQINPIFQSDSPLRLFLLQTYS